LTTEEIQGHVIPIPPDPDLDKMDKKTAAYRYKLHKLSCILCTNIATQMICFDVDGAMIRRYCDACVSKVTNQSTSGSGKISKFLSDKIE
jgi:hypothetical protein